MKLNSKYLFFVITAFFLCWTNLAYCEVSTAVIDHADQSFSYHTTLHTQALFLENILIEEIDVEESEDDDSESKSFVSGSLRLFIFESAVTRSTCKYYLQKINRNAPSKSLVMLYHSWRHDLLS